MSAEDDVRRLLADAGSDDRMPPEVAARLEARLRELAQERDVGRPAPQVPQPARRRWPQVILAAAAVVVVAYGVGAVVEKGSLTGSGSEDTTLSTEAGAGDATAPSSPSAAESPGSPQQLEGIAGPVLLRSQRLAGDVRRVLTTEVSALTKDAQRRSTQRDGRCTPRTVTAGHSWVPATYDGRRAALVIGPPHRQADGGRVVAARVLSCAGEVLASVTVPAR